MVNSYYRNDAMLGISDKKQQVPLGYVLLIGLLQVSGFFLLKSILGLILVSLMKDSSSFSGLSGAALLLTIAGPLRLLITVVPILIIGALSAYILTSFNASRSWLIATTGTLTSFFVLVLLAPSAPWFSLPILIVSLLSSVMYGALYVVFASDSTKQRLVAGVVLTACFLGLPTLASFLH